MITLTAPVLKQIQDFLWKESGSPTYPEGAPFPGSPIALTLSHVLPLIVGTNHANGLTVTPMFSKDAVFFSITQGNKTSQQVIKWKFLDQYKQDMLLINQEPPTQYLIAATRGWTPRAANTVWRDDTAENIVKNYTLEESEGEK